jgi:tripartite-type tricarboxylate transporter receptor subunit TctC
MKKYTVLLIVLLNSLFISQKSFAQNWPSKPVKVVVTLSAGSTSDILARIICEQLTRNLGQSFVVENRPGAGGNIAGEYVMHQPADGYTVMLSSISSHGINPALYAKMPYDAINDFTPIIAIASSPNVLIASNNTPAISTGELINWINKTYAGQYTPTTDTTDTDTSSDEGGYLSSWAGNVAKTIMPVGTSIDVRSMVGLKEEIDRIKKLL